VTDDVVIVGVGQIRRRPALDGPWRCEDPATLMAHAVTMAAHDAGGVAVLGEIDTVACVDPMAWAYTDLPREVAQRGAATNTGAFRQGLTVQPGGTSPVELLGEVATRIVAGESRTAVVAGGDAMYSRRRARREGVQLDWPPYEGHRDFYKGQRSLTNELEQHHGIAAPIHCFPLFENALRHAAGRSIDAHQAYISELMATHSQVAASNPYAWFPDVRTAAEIRAVTDENRWICFPYTKRMNPIMEVDQAAALIVTSRSHADELAIAPQRRVSFAAGAHALDAWTPTERTDFVSSLALEACCEDVFERCEICADQIDAFDLYSCFPSAVEMAMDALGLSSDDTRPRTVTGGLAYGGGPGNAYSMLALAGMVERLRRKPSIGFVSALGMAAAKHAVCLLSSDSRRTRGDHTLRHLGQRAGGSEPVLAASPDGRGAVETYTIEYERHNMPERVIVVVRLDDGRRTVALCDTSPATVATFTLSEAIGRRGAVRGAVGPLRTNVFELAS
jgi:acetyl-CoA C-acetyltransferase